MPSHVAATAPESSLHRHVDLDTEKLRHGTSRTHRRELIGDPWYSEERYLQVYQQPFSPIVEPWLHSLVKFEAI
jgi:hypothetical protein